MAELQFDTIRAFSSGAVVYWLLLLVLLLFISLLWERGRAGRRVRNHRAIGASGEKKARKILKRCGYTVLDAQATGSYRIYVDGQAVSVHLRADFLVQRDGRTYVAEAKSTEVAARITGRATRRQLLEYLFAFEVSGVLLVDVESEEVHSVSFPLPRSSLSLAG